LTAVSLITFHRLLIAVAIVFCAGFAVWEVRRFLTVGGAGALVLAAVFALLALLLFLYLRRLNRILGLERAADRNE
jgi:hypothetical protein